MHIVLGIVRHVEVDDQCYVVNVYATCHYVRGNEYVGLCATEQIHHLVAFLLGEVAMHGTAVELCPGQRDGQVLGLYLAACEDNYTFWFPGLE